jgi:hypothetical protein
VITTQTTIPNYTYGVLVFLVVASLGIGFVARMFVVERKSASKKV